MNEWGMRPLPISATCYHDRVLSVRLSGAPSAIAAATKRIGGDALLDADNGAGFWRSVRDQTHPYFAGATPGRALWRLSVKATAPAADLDGDCLIEWGGALRWLVAAPGTDAGRLRAWAAENGGHATIFRATDKSPGVFQPLPKAVAGLHRRLKDVFDPAGIFNPGRMYATF
jgi:glycolate oxidase FAD binding subunit